MVLLLMWLTTITEVATAKTSMAIYLITIISTAIISLTLVTKVIIKIIGKPHLSMLTSHCQSLSNRSIK